jgi:citrate synthase
VTDAQTVADVMNPDPVTGQPSETISTVAERMDGAGVGAVVVIDDTRRPIGILTERDLVRFAASGADTSTAKLSEWMTEDPDTVGTDVTVADAFHGLVSARYRHIPVIEGGALVGIVSLRRLANLAQLEPVEHPGHLEAPKGLEGVVVAATTVGDVRGQEGFYHYRQYSATELAEKRSIEDVWHLMFLGDLPTPAESEAFSAEVNRLRVVPPEVAEVLPAVARASDPFVPLDALRTAVSLLAQARGFRPWLDTDIDTLRAEAMHVCAVIPTLIMALHRLSNGEEPVEPDDELGYAANYLYMLTGDRPPADHARAIEQYLISTVDHGFNASTFTARVVTSTGADLGAAVVAAIGALSGPLHGGAPSRALGMLDEIQTPDRAEAWVRTAVERGDRIMGFGHRVYKTDDPRSVMLRSVAERLGGPRVELARAVERTVIDTLAELKPGRQLYTNVEFYAGVVMEEVGLPADLFTPTFASSRTIGWCANILEQAADNRLIRPSADYVGPPPPQPVPEA